MKNLFYQPALSSGTLHLDADESRHATKVLRRKAGDIIHVTDGKGNLYTCRITDPKPGQCTFVVESVQREKDRAFHIHIAIAPTKNADRIEWFVEKAIEIGIDEISFVECDNSERTTIKPDRIQKLVISAMKQSLKFSIPKINPVRQLRDFINDSGSGEKYIAFVDQNNPDELSKRANVSSRYVVLVGPEGDFTPAELDAALKHGFTKVALGPSRLRTETAGLVACHTLNLINL